MLVVVGGGISGVSCVEQLSQLCPNEEILIISATPLIKACTNVKQVSTVLTDFNVEEKTTSYLELLYPNVKVIFGKVESLDCEKHELYLEDKRTIHYNKLCICTGGKPKLLNTNNKNVIGIRDTETIEDFQKRLLNARCIVIVGNGGIATELVYELENFEVIWAIRDSSIGATFFDAGAAQFFLPQLNMGQKEAPKGQQIFKRIKYAISNDEEWSQCGNSLGSSLGPDWATNLNTKSKASDDFKNVQVETECEVLEILTKEEIVEQRIELSNTKKDRNWEWCIYVKLTNGKVYGCDFVVSATGITPNTQPIENNSNFKFAEDGGILVNNQMQCCKDVYAAGDVCSIGWEPAKHWFQMRLWTQARQMGLYAAQCIQHNIKGEEKIMDICFDLFTHVTQFFGFKVILLGLYNCQTLGKNCELLLRMTKAQEYIKVVLQDGKMQGAILIGETDLEETFENLILNQLDLSRFGEDLLNPDIDIEDYFD